MNTVEHEVKPDEPTSFDEAWNYPDPKERGKWREAIQKEYHQMLKNGVWRRHFKVLLAIWISKRYSARLLDVKTAFIYGVLEEELFFSIPKGYEEFLKEAFGEELKGKDLDLKKTIYGLVQAAREWWKKFIRTLKEKLGFKQYQSNNCLLMREDEAGFVAVGIHVNACLTIGDEKAVNKFVSDVKEFLILQGKK